MTILNIRNVIAILFAIAKIAIVVTRVSAQAVPPPDSADELPPHVMASCLANGCSATIISKGPGWASGVTACHCFFNDFGQQTVPLGGKIPVKFIDGSKAEGRLLWLNNSIDMARFAVPSHNVLGVSRVAVGTHDKARYEMIGFPGWDASLKSIPYDKRRPFFFLLRPADHPVVQFGGSMYRWHFLVDRGGVYPGVSGSGIYANGQLVGTLSNNNGHRVATECFCSTPDQLAGFLKASDAAGCDKWNLGTWSEKAVSFSDAPPQLAYENDSNRPLYQCRGGHCWQILEKPQVPPPPPPPDAGHDPDPQNLSERIAITPGKGSEGYSGKGKPPKDLNHNKMHAKEIDELRGRVLKLEELAVSGQLKGEKGDSGEDGKDFTPIEKSPAKHDFTPLIIACLVAVGLGKFVGYKLGF